MINKNIIDSDAFLDMPQTTQNLYFHLNMRADDDGFLDKPKNGMRSISSNQNDLEILLAKRYLMAFASGVIVIKHWKLHNSIRKDRYKPTMYQEELKTLIEKDNGSYTEAFKALQQNEIDQWQPNDNQMATNGTHRLVQSSPVESSKAKVIKEKKIKKEINTSPFQSYDPNEDKRIEESTSYKIDQAIAYWNTMDGLQKTKRLTANIDVRLRTNIIASVKLYSLDEIINSMDNYLTVLSNPQTYKPSAVYGDVFGFLSSGIDKYWDESKPLRNMKIEKVQEFRSDTIQKKQDEYCHCGAKKVNGICPECEAVTGEEAREAFSKMKFGSYASGSDSESDSESTNESVNIVGGENE